MLRWFANLPIIVKAFAAPALLLLCLCGLSARSYFASTTNAAGLAALSRSKLPLWDAAERLGDALSGTQLLLFRYVSWLNSGVDAATLRKAEDEIKTRSTDITKRIDELLMRADLPSDERRILESVRKNWDKFEKVSKDSTEMGAVQPSMAVMMLGEVDDLMGTIRGDIDRISQSNKLAGEQFAISMAESSKQSHAILLGTIAIVIPLSILVSLFGALSIITPIRHVTKNMLAISAGKLDASIGYADRLDEIGRMVRAITIFRQNAAHIRRLEDQQHDEQRRNIERRKAEMNALAAEFETSVKLIASRLTETARKMNASSIELTKSAAETRDRSETMTQVVNVTSTSVQSVAGAAQQMWHTIQELAVQVTKTSESVRLTATETHRVGGAIEQLARAIEQITSIVGLIQGIAEQTNLLALNATIEAARAGEAGRGFGVVAAEVKALASQTERATSEISARITAVRSSCSVVAASIGSIVGAIQNVDSLSQAISGAINEQTTGTAEIANSAASARASVKQVTELLSRLVSAANQTDDIAKTAKTETQNLLQDADTVNQKVNTFLASIRTA